MLFRSVSLRLATGVGGPAEILARCRAVRQRRQALRPFHIRSDSFGQPATVVLIAMPEMPDHPQLDILRALFEVGDDVVDQVIPLPILELPVALAGLAVVGGGAGGLRLADGLGVNGLTGLGFSLVAALVKTQGANRFSEEVLTNPSGFAGTDGVFRFRNDGTSERGLAVMEIRNGAVRPISPAPTSFATQALSN